MRACARRSSRRKTRSPRCARRSKRRNCTATTSEGCCVSTETATATAAEALTAAWPLAVAVLVPMQMTPRRAGDERARRLGDDQRQDGGGQPRGRRDGVGVASTLEQRARAARRRRRRRRRTRSHAATTAVSPRAPSPRWKRGARHGARREEGARPELTAAEHASGAEAARDTHVLARHAADEAAAVALAEEVVAMRATRRAAFAAWDVRHCIARTAAARSRRRSSWR